MEIKEGRMRSNGEDIVNGEREGELKSKKEEEEEVKRRE